jgi:putative phosphoesterase
MKLGIISDTHGLFDPKLPALFDGVEHILHGGDVGSGEILVQLEKIAPVTAVLGNNDAGMNLRETEVLGLDGRKFLVHHIVDVRHPADGIRERIAREVPDVVVFGHTHKPHAGQLGHTLYFNPGYAGRPRFNLTRSVALLHLDGAELRWEFKSL